MAPSAGFCIYSQHRLLSDPCTHQLDLVHMDGNEEGSIKDFPSVCRKMSIVLKTTGQLQGGAGSETSWLRKAVLNWAGSRISR